jgi:hypothetical protein
MQAIIQPGRAHWIRRPLKMVSLQTLETTKKNLSLVISTSSPVICTRGFTDDNYFNLKIGVPQDKAFQALNVRFKVLVKC